MLDLSAPYVQRALLEMLLLAVPAGAARELDRAAPARLLHPRGRHGDASPGWCWRAPGGSRRSWRRSPRRSGFGGGAGAARARRAALDADAATGLLLVGALAAGVVLASDVFESGAEVDTLLFGSLIGLERERRVAHGAGRGRRRGARRRAAAALARDRIRARPAPARSALRPVLGRPAAARRRSRSRRSSRSTPSARCWSTVVLVVPAATARLLTDRAGAAAARRDRARGGRGGRGGLARRRAQRRRRARRSRCSAARVFAARRGRDGAARAGGAGMTAPCVGVARALAAATCRARDALRDVSFAAGGRRDRRRARPQRRRQDDALPRPARRAADPARRASSCAGRPAYVPQTERARLDFPVSALDVVLMGAYARTPWLRRVAGARPRGRARGARARRARRRARRDASARSPAGSASAC